MCWIFCLCPFGCRFSSGFQLATFVTSSGLLYKSWNAIISPPSHAATGSNVGLGLGLSWKVYKEPDNGLTIIAFDAALLTDVQPDLVPSSALKDKNFLNFQRSPLFHVNKDAINLFYENHQKLDQLKSQVHLLLFFPFIVPSPLGFPVEYLLAGASLAYFGY